MPFPLLSLQGSEDEAVTTEIPQARCSLLPFLHICFQLLRQTMGNERMRVQRVASRSPGSRVRITAGVSDRRPVGTSGQRRRAETRKLTRSEDNFTPNDRQHRFDILNLLLWNGEVISRENCEVGYLPRHNGTFLVLFGREPATANSPQS